MLTVPQSMALVAVEPQIAASMLPPEVSIVKAAGVKAAGLKKLQGRTRSRRKRAWSTLWSLVTSAATLRRVYAASNQQASVVWLDVKITRNCCRMPTNLQSMALAAVELQIAASTLHPEVFTVKAVEVQVLGLNKIQARTLSRSMRAWVMLRFVVATSAATLRPVCAASNRPASVVLPAVRITRR